MIGKPMLSLLPLGDSVLKRLEPLGRIEQWDSEIGSSVETLDMEVWFVRGYDNSGGEENIYGVWILRFRPVIFIWSPSPGIAIIIID